MGITVNTSPQQITASVGETQIDVAVSGGFGPSGNAGAAGQAASVTVGTVTTGAAGSQASVTNVGTSSAAVLNFTIPAGATGATGPQGPAGAAGASAWADITGKPSFAAVATSGAYSDLTGTPAAYSLPTATGSVLGGVKIGSGVSIDGSGVISVSTAYAASTHSHAIADVTGLQTALDGKQASGSYAASAHNHAASDLTSGTLDIARIPTGSSSTTVCIGNDSRLSDARTPTAHNQAWSTITSTPTTLAGYGITDAAAASHAHSGSDITSGTVAVARLGSGSPSSANFLRGDGTWAAAGSTNASDLTSGTLAYARIADPTVTSPSQITASQNDYASFARGINRFTTNAARDLTGMVAGSDGEIRILTNVGTTAANTLTIKDQSSSSTAANRFAVPWAGDCVISAGASVAVYYDNTTARWRVIA